MRTSFTSTSTDPLTHRLAEKEHYLRHLEKVAARYGRAYRFDVDLELEDTRREIMVLKQTIQTIKPNHTAVDTDDLPIVRTPLIEQITEQLLSVTQTLHIVTDELDYLSQSLHDSIQYLLQTSTVQAQELGARWAAIQEQPQTTVVELRSLLREIWQLEATLHPLELREIHRRLLNLMDQQQATHQHLLQNDTIRQGLEADIQTAQSAITAIKRKWRQTPHDRTMLAIHTQNVQWNQEILAGERPYTPIGLLRQIEEEESAIDRIDAQLLRGDSTEQSH